MPLLNRLPHAPDFAGNAALSNAFSHGEKTLGGEYGLLDLLIVDRSSRGSLPRRPYSRLLKKAMSIKETDDSLISLYVSGAVITDNYRFKTKGSKLTYKDVKFSWGSCFELALNGDTSFLPKKPSCFLQLTLIGSYEKSWKKEDGAW